MIQIRVVERDSKVTIISKELSKAIVILVMRNGCRGGIAQIMTREFRRERIGIERTIKKGTRNRSV